MPFQVGPADEPANGQRGLRPVIRPAPGQCTISVRQVWSLTGQARRYANPDGAGRARGPGRARTRSRGSDSDLLQDGQSTVKVADACGHSSRLFTPAAVSGPAAPASGVNPSESSAKKATARCWLCSFALYFSALLVPFWLTPLPHPLLCSLHGPPREQILVHFGLLGPASGPAYLRSASAPRRRRVIPARGPPLRTRAPRARSALAAPRPGPRGPGPGSSSRADVTGSGRSGPRLALRVERTSRAPVAPGPD